MFHLLHENKSQVLIIQMVDMQMEQAKSYELIQGLVCNIFVGICIGQQNITKNCSQERLKITDVCGLMHTRHTSDS